MTVDSIGRIQVPTHTSTAIQLISVLNWMAILAPNPIPSPHSPPLLHRPPHRRLLRHHFFVKPNSSSPSSVVVTQQDDSPLPSEPTEDPQFRGCKACGREEIEKGCNGEGRIQGGIATVPGFGWWPIKAFRPCPGFVASGGRYKRRGQTMDEVTSGRGRDISSQNTNKTESSKNSRGPSRLEG